MSFISARLFNTAPRACTRASTRVFQQQSLRLPQQTFASPYLRTMATQSNIIPPFKSGTVMDALTKDHSELKQYYEEVINNPNNLDHQERFGNQFTWELARHSVAEELIIYPAFEKYLGPKGHEMAEKDRKEHHAVKEQLKKFQNMKPKDSEYIPTLKSLWADLEQHIKEEENDDIPALEKVLASDHANTGVSEKLAKTFGRTKVLVPSRSHPSAGENPPFESVMGLLTAPIDHIADIFRKFPDKTINPNPSTK